MQIDKDHKIIKDQDTDQDTFKILCNSTGGHFYVKCWKNLQHPSGYCICCKTKLNLPKILRRVR